MLARPPHPSALATCLFVAACAATACGGGTEGGSGGSAGTTTTNSGGTSTGGTGVSGGGTGGSGGGTAGSGGTGAAGGATGGTGTGGGTTSSGGTGGSGGGAQGPTIACDALSCPVPDKACCQHYNQPAECLSPDATCTYGVPLACDGPEDCQAGQLCCAQISTQGAANAYVSVACAATCTGKDYRVVCGASGACPAGKTCGTSDMLPPYLDCK